MAETAHSLGKELAFLISDAARLLRTYTDQQARAFGSTRAQWAVLSRLSKCEGMSQSELAGLLDIQPITLARLVDKLCHDGLVKRLPDETDRRVKRLHLTPRARTVLDPLETVAEEIVGTALAGLGVAERRDLIAKMQLVKQNLKARLQPADASE